jgi:predicted TIM-barrel fold metal-dependent hydrolase
MKIVDVDTHCIETAAVWEHLAAADEEYRPAILRKETGATIQTHFSGPQTKEYWVIDNHLYGKHDAELIAKYSKGEFDVGAITLADVPSRLASMDRQGVDVQVIFSSLFLNVRCERARAELALTRAYNRWMAERCAESEGRLRWLFVPSLKNPEATVVDMQWAKDQGAVGLFLRGIEGDKFLDHPDFDPIYARAVELDWPVCIHIGHGSPAMESIAQREGGKFNRFVSDSPNYFAFSILLTSTLPKSFPTLRFGFFESGCSWVPSAVQTALHVRLKPDDLARMSREKLAEHNVFLTCELHEDLPRLLQYIPEDRLLGSSDFGHPGDIADSMFYVNEYRTRTDIPESAKKMIVEDNAYALFRF